jgi:preprotein translocase subunit YajC
MNPFTLISPAYAQDAAGFLGPATQFAPLILIFVVFYFLMIRPQQKKAKAQREMVNALRRGDRVLLQGGIYGQVAKVISDTEVLVEIADKVQIRVTRGAVGEVLEKTQPVSPIETSEDKPAQAKRSRKKIEDAVVQPAIAAPVATPAPTIEGGVEDKAE